MACGVPVVVSAHESLDEASGDAAVRADPEDPAAFAAAIERALAERDALVARGLEHVKAVLVARGGRGLPPRVRGGAGVRGDQEIVVVVRRGPEFLVMRRAPERLGYWSLVAGGLEPDETPTDAAQRELFEETGLESKVRPLPIALSYSLLDDPPAIRARYAPGVETVTVHAFVVDAPVKWEPTLDAEHDRYEWCDLDEALELLFYDTTKDAVASRSTRAAVKVGVDTSPLVQTRAGTARHVRGLLGALRDRPGLDLELLSFGGPGRASSVARDAVWYPVGLGRRARSLDVLHCTTFRGPVAARVPTVLTVHDLAILRAPEVFPRWHRLYGRAGLVRVLRAADAIVAVSEFSRDETIELAGVPAERIRVVPHGVDPVFSPDGPRADGDYVLAVATLEPRKNLERAVDAAREAGVELRVVGARGWGGVEVDGWVGEIPDAELAALYRGARCVLYPSLYEGFGLPVLEAMACGTPVVTSVGTAMEEVAGGAAVLVDPLDVASIADGVREAHARRDELVARGSGTRREFTWQRAADAVVELWSDLA